MGAYHKIYDIQRQLLGFFFLVFCLCLMFPLGMLIDYLFSPHWSIYIFASILYIVACALAGSYIFVITLLPVKLMRGFDHIQNGIAEGSINDDSGFAEAINSFTIEHFDYLFFDISQSAFYIQQTEKVFYSEGFNIELIAKIDEYKEQSKASHDVTYIGKYVVDDLKLHYYLVPVWFGTNPLGFLLVGTRNKLGRFFIGFLHDYENLFIDDQLLHIVNRLKKE